MLNTKIQDAFNKQLNAELFSGYLYLSMAAYFESHSLKGMAHWMRLQAAEELQHALKFFDFINDRGGRALLASVEGPQAEWSSPRAAFEEAYEHERKVTGLIHNLVQLSTRENDHASSVFLQWFVSEQVEEEASAQEIAEKLKLIGDNPVALFMIDRELGQRAPGEAGEA
jgi:ferritin